MNTNAALFPSAEGTVLADAVLQMFEFVCFSHAEPQTHTCVSSLISVLSHSDAAAVCVCVCVCMCVCVCVCVCVCENGTGYNSCVCGCAHMVWCVTVCVCVCVFRDAAGVLEP